MNRSVIDEKINDPVPSLKYFKTKSSSTCKRYSVGYVVSKLWEKFNVKGVLWKFRCLLESESGVTLMMERILSTGRFWITKVYSLNL